MVAEVISQKLVSLVSIVLAIGVFFRLGNLGNKLYSHDEAYTSFRAAGYTWSEAISAIWDGRVISREDIQVFLRPGRGKNLLDTLSVNAREEPQESPLYFILAHQWMLLIGNSPAVMRGLAALFSLFVIPALYWLCLELFRSHRTALLSAMIISLSPFNILFAQDARSYSLWALMIIISSTMFLIAIRENKKFAWGGYTISSTFGLYTHQLFLLVLIAHACYLVVIKESRLERRVLRYMVSSFFALFIFAPWLYQIFTHWNQVTDGLRWTGQKIYWSQYISRWAIIWASPILDLEFGSRNIIPYLLRVPVLLLNGFALCFLIKSTPRRIWAFLLLLICVTTLPLVLVDLLHGGIRSIQGRYFTPGVLMIIPVVAHLLIEKLSMPRTYPRVLWILIIALLIAAQVGSSFNIFWAKTWWNKDLSPNDPEIVHILNQASHPLFIINGITPSDLGDVLALSLMVDQDVRFKLHQKPGIIELPAEFAEIYWYHQTYMDFLESQSGKQFNATEVVPYRLWRINSQTE